MIGLKIRMLVDTCYTNTDIPEGSVILIDEMYGNHPCGIVISSKNINAIGVRLDRIHIRGFGDTSDRYEILDVITRVSFITRINRNKLEEIFDPSYIRRLLDSSVGHPDYLILQQLWNELSESNFENP